MTDDIQRYTTDSAPGEQAFESTVNEATTFFEEAFDADKSDYGPRARAILRSCIRAALRATGTASLKTVTNAARSIRKREGLASSEIEPVWRRLEVMIDNNNDSENRHRDHSGGTR